MKTIAHPKIKLDDVEASVLVFEANTWKLRYDCNPEYFALRDIHDVHRIQGINETDGWGSWWLLFVEDCFSPPMYIVRAKNETEAIEIFLDTWTACQIDEADYKDYMVPCDENDPEREQGMDTPLKWQEDVHWDSYGHPCDIESLKMFHATLVSAEF
jgi:hypothetical protein